MAKLKDLVVAIGANTTDFDKKLGKSMGVWQEHQAPR
jgi:hypothetical protein